jgi:hypothetical protein
MYFLFFLALTIFLVAYFGILAKKDKKKDNVQKMIKSYAMKNMEAIKNMDDLEDRESIECFYYSYLKMSLSILFSDLIESLKLKLGRQKIDMIFKTLNKTDNIDEGMLELSKDESWEILSFYRFPQLIYAIVSYTKYKSNPEKFNLKSYLSNVKNNLENDINWNTESRLDLEKFFEEKECDTFDRAFFVIYYKYVFETYLSFVMAKFSGMNRKFTVSNTDIGFLISEYSKDPTLWKIMVDYNFPAIVSVWVTFKLIEYGFHNGSFQNGGKLRTIFKPFMNKEKSYNNPESWKFLESNMKIMI